jgi:DNA-binding NarL/FixJ family response regulator
MDAGTNKRQLQCKIGDPNLLGRIARLAFKEERDHCMDASLRVLIADDHPLILQGIRRNLQAAAGISVAGEARSGRELLALLERRRPQLVLLDLRMPEPDGLECITRIARSWPDVRTVVLSACEEPASIEAALGAGASAYVLKSANPADLPSVLLEAWSGRTSRPALAPLLRPAQQPGPAACGLTRRETAILQAVADGLTTRAISQQLWLSEHTVKFHLTNIYRKLGVSNRSAAVRYAFESRLAPLPPAAGAAA